MYWQIFSTSTCFNTRKRTGQEPCSCIYGASPMELASNTRQVRDLVPVFLCRPDRASLSTLASQGVKPGTLSLSYRYTWQSFSVEICFTRSHAKDLVPVFCYTWQSFSVETCFTRSQAKDLVPVLDRSDRASLSKLASQEVKPRTLSSLYNKIFFFLAAIKVHKVFCNYTSEN